MDFTHCGELGVTVSGEPFDHLLFHFVLSHSGWRYVDLAYGETFAALVKGMQGALWELGGVPEVLRTDNLSAATHELKGSGGRALNERCWRTTGCGQRGRTRGHPTRTAWPSRVTTGSRAR